MSNYVILVVSKKHKMRSRSTNHEALTVLCFVCFGILGDGDWGFSVQDSLSLFGFPFPHFVRHTTLRPSAWPPASPR